MNIWIANGISTLASLFMIASCITKHRERVFHLQFIQCILLSISSYFLSSYSGIAANLVSGFRNLAVAKGYFSKRMMIFFLVISLGLGLAVNNRGWIGLLPMIANLQFALCSYACTSLKGTKLSIWVNVVIWILYSFLVMDIATGISDTIVLIINTITIIRISIKEKKEHELHLAIIQNKNN